MRDLLLLRTITVGVLRGYAAYRVVLVVGTTLMALVEGARNDNAAQTGGRFGDLLYMAPQIITTCVICGLIWGLSRKLANWLVVMPPGNACPNCNHDLSGVPAGAACPRCGVASGVAHAGGSLREAPTRPRFIARLCVLAVLRALAIYFMLAYGMAVVREIFNAASPSQFQAPASLATVGPVVVGVAMTVALWFLAPLIARAACPMPGPDTLSPPARPA